MIDSPTIWYVRMRNIHRSALFQLSSSHLPYQKTTQDKHTSRELGKEKRIWAATVWRACMQQVAVGEASDEHAEHERHVRPPPPPPYHHVARQQQQQQQQWRMATTTAAFHSRRPPMNPISKFVPTPLQQTSIVLEDPYQVPRMLLQPDKFLVWQSGLVDLISSSLWCIWDLVVGNNLLFSQRHISLNLYIRIQQEIKLMSGILIVFSFVHVGCVGLPLDVILLLEKN